MSFSNLRCVSWGEIMMSRSLSVILVFLVGLGLGISLNRVYVGPAEAVDGDTVKIPSYVPFIFDDYNFRLRGLSAADDGDFAEKATTYMKSLVNGRWVVCWFTGDVNSGRLDSFCSVDFQDIAPKMIRAGLACASLVPKFRVERYVKPEMEVGKRPCDCGKGEPVPHCE